MSLGSQLEAIAPNRKPGTTDLKHAQVQTIPLWGAGGDGGDTWL